jgi:hypothetical protein
MLASWLSIDRSKHRGNFKLLEELRFLVLTLGAWRRYLRLMFLRRIALSLLLGIMNLSHLHVMAGGFENFLSLCSRNLRSGPNPYEGHPEKRVNAQAHAHIARTHFLRILRLDEYLETKAPDRARLLHDKHVRRTSLFPEHITPEDVFEQLPDSYQGLPQSLNGDMASYVVPMTLYGRQYKVKVGRCVSENCHNFRKGELIHLYPVCGPDVIVIDHAAFLRSKRTGQNYRPQLGVPCDT